MSIQPYFIRQAVGSVRLKIFHTYITEIPFILCYFIVINKQHKRSLTRLR